MNHQEYNDVSVEEAVYCAKFINLPHSLKDILLIQKRLLTIDELDNLQEHLQLIDNQYRCSCDDCSIDLEINWLNKFFVAYRKTHYTNARH